MSLGDFSFDPVTGHYDESVFLEFPPTGKTREYMQKLHDQTRDWLNNNVKPELNNHLTDNAIHGLQVIETKTLAAPAAQVDFTTNVSGWKKYVLIGMTKGTTATNRSIYIRINDGSSGYAQVETKVSSSTLTASTSTANSAFILTNALADSSIGLGIATFEVEIYKINGGQYGFKSKHLTYTTNLEKYDASGYYGSSTVLSKISLIASADSFATNSVFILAGIR